MEFPKKVFSVIHWLILDKLVQFLEIVYLCQENVTFPNVLHLTVTNYWKNSSALAYTAPTPPLEQNAREKKGQLRDFWVAELDRTNLFRIKKQFQTRLFFPTCREKCGNEKGIKYIRLCTWKDKVPAPRYTNRVLKLLFLFGWDWCHSKSAQYNL